jgi:hypothetical protein
MLPQVLAGLGLFSVLSASCLIWLQRLQPLFFAVAVASLAYQVWLIWQRPAHARTRGMKLILSISAAINIILIAGWIVISIRYA